MGGNNANDMYNDKYYNDDAMNMNVLIGDTKTNLASQNFRLGLSTEKSYLNVFSAACTNDNYCDVVKTY